MQLISFGYYYGLVGFGRSPRPCAARTHLLNSKRDTMPPFPPQLYCSSFQKIREISQFWKKKNQRSCCSFQFNNATAGDKVLNPSNSPLQSLPLVFWSFSSFSILLRAPIKQRQTGTDTYRVDRPNFMTRSEGRMRCIKMSRFSVYFNIL